MVKYGVYLLGITIIGVGIGFIILADVGYGPWDIFYFNFVELFNTSFTVAQTLLSFLLVLAGFALRKQRIDRSIIIITINSAYLALWIDLMLKFNSPTSALAGYSMLLTGLLFVAVGVNMARYTNIVLPALDFFTRSVYFRSKLSYGRIRQIMEAIVLVIGTSVGLIYSLDFKLGLGTVIILIMGGYLVNLTYKPVCTQLAKIIK